MDEIGPFLGRGVARVTFHLSFWAACSLRILHSFPGGEHFILTGYAEYAVRQVKPDAETFEACQLLPSVPAPLFVFA